MPMLTLPTLALLLGMAARLPLTGAAESGNGTAIAEGGCADDNAFLTMCDGWSIAFVATASVLGLLIVVRLFMSFCSCELGSGSAAEDAPPASRSETLRV